MTGTSLKQKIYTSQQIFLAAFLGGPMGGAWFISRNYQAFGEPEKSSKTMKIAWAWLLLMPALGAVIDKFLPKAFLEGMPFAEAALLSYLSETYQKNGLKAAKERGIPAGSSWCLAGISLVWVVISVAVFFPLDFIYFTWGWIAYCAVIGAIFILTVIVSKIPTRFDLILKRTAIGFGAVIVLVAILAAYAYATFPTLLLPSMQGNASRVEELLAKGADPNARDLLNDTALMFATNKGHADVVKALINGGADVNLKSRLGGTALQTAAHRGYTDVVKALIDKGADVNAGNDRGDTPLTVAAQFGHIEIVQLLLEKGANLEIRDGDGDTPLMDAAYGGQAAIVQFLLDKGADISVTDKKGKTAITQAEEMHHEDVATLLKNYKKK